MSEADLLGVLPLFSPAGAAGAVGAVAGRSAAVRRAPGLRRLLDGVRALRRAGRVGATEQHALAYSAPESARLAEVASGTRVAESSAFMMVGPVKAQLLAMLVHAVRARDVLEIGTFTGYSALAMAEALPPDGRIVTCEADPVRADLARRNLTRGGVADRVRVELGPALETIERLAGPFDLVFVDADKTGYVDYFHAVLPKLSQHGLIVVDNTLHEGLIAHDDGSRERSAALHAFNQIVRDDPRVAQVVLPLQDGLTVIRRTPAR